ncbi:hypothetical protein N7492_003649, partial [Penicillium capsulatum]
HGAPSLPGWCAQLHFFIPLHLIMAVGIFNSTYYGKDYRAGAALLRARRPYLFKNAATGLGLFVFSIGVCTYRILLFGFLAPIPSTSSRRCPAAAPIGDSTAVEGSPSGAFGPSLKDHCANHYLLYVDRCLHHPRRRPRRILRRESPRRPRAESTAKISHNVYYAVIHGASVPCMDWIIVRDHPYTINVHPRPGVGSRDWLGQYPAGKQQRSKSGLWSL